MKTYYYQLVRQYGKHDIEYILHEARMDEQKNIEIAAIPFTLVGNHPGEILDTLKSIERDMKKYPPVDKGDCNIFHDTLIYEEEDYLISDSSEDKIEFGHYYYEDEENVND